MTATTELAADFQVRAIGPGALSELRERDDCGHAPRLLTDQAGGSPLRCCLRRSHPGERVALVSYAPLRRWARETGADPGPYDEIGPVFIHPGPCPGPAGPGYPADFTGTHRVFRAYSAQGKILSGHLVGPDKTADPVRAGQVLAAMFADPAVALVHVRAVEFGCFTFEARRGM
jgi:hypothetical protein